MRRQATDPQPPANDEEEDKLEKPERAPSFLSARELQAREPAKGRATEEESSDEPEEPAEKPRGRKGGG